MEWLKDCNDKFVVVDNYRFTLDEKTGYYRCNKLKKRLHQYIWIKYNGEIPKGYHVHHKDHKKQNNHPDNLAIVAHSKHATYHERDKMKDKEYLKWRKENFENKARPKAVEWHKSDEGRKWHSEHAKKIAETRGKTTFECKQCNEKFDAWNTSKNRFCSNKCKSAWRRANGLDDVERVCIICGIEFKVNKYSKTKTCSNDCRTKLHWKNRKASE
jgi:HNH endonuclease